MTSAICLDWGSTNLRAFLIVDGHVRDTRHCAQGVKSVVGAQAFEATFMSITEGWRENAARAVLAGMVTSRNGWVESPYLTLPARLGDLLAHGVSRSLGRLELTFLPGLAQQNPADVIRGEEIQLAGVADTKGRKIVVAPGTHSKWIELDGDKVVRFRTVMTGELFDLIRHHSLAGKLADGDSFDPDAVRQGADLARANVPLTAIFQARSRVLLGDLDPVRVSSFLSGLLIGTELLEMGRSFNMAKDEAITLIASNVPAQAYMVALDHFGVGVAERVENAAEKGFMQLLSAGSTTSTTGPRSDFLLPE